ncbi:hypothetical protein BG004_005959 [Podila humilis]|nr:hypothetical protein BG004_005959 [Podila humilis]
MPKASKDVSWKSELSKLPFPSYFKKIENPNDIRFIDFVQESATCSSSKRDLNHSWKFDIIAALKNSELQILREAGTTLMQRWPKDKQTIEVARFWQDLEEREAKERHLHALHVGVYERETAVTKSHTRNILVQFDADRFGPFVETKNAARHLQKEAAPFINDENQKVSIKKLYLMLSANSIWDTTVCLPGMSIEAHRRVLLTIKPEVIRLSAEITRLFVDLSHELASTGRVRCREMETEEEEDVLKLFLDLSKKLPSLALPFVVDNEDTYSHGSRERRGAREANKPDGTILKEQFDMAFAEIKAPKDDRSTRLYIQDKWTLTSLAKDTIDLHMRERRTIISICCLQVFGYQLAVYELRFQAGLYTWVEIGTGYLPRDKNDTLCLIRCMELLITVKSLLDAIPVRQYIHTPPQRDPDNLLPEEFRPQPTTISPSSRRFFGCIIKASADTTHK